MTYIADKIQQNVILAPFTSFKVGGKAKYYITPEDISELRQSLAWACDNNQQVFIFGNGTNLVFSDNGYDGLVIHTARMKANINWDNSTVTADAGVSLNHLIKSAVTRGFTGIQRLAGIPGTLGGGVYINAGAFGQEIGDSILEVLSCKADGSLTVRKSRECEFSYRHSIYCENDEFILQAVLCLTPGHTDTLKEEMNEILKKRRAKQPLHLPNAGSIFKRPPGNYAGTLIENTGLKGLTVGGAMISEKHANFIVNANNASAQDIYDLSELIIARVKAASGVLLQKEVRFIGRFS